MRKILTAIIMLLIIMFLSGYTSKDKEINIFLRGNPTTGYEWTYSVDRTGILKEKYHKYVPDTTSSTLVGVGGIYHFSFVGDSPGIVTLTFQYARLFESKEPLYKTIYVIRVDDDMKINLVKSYGKYYNNYPPIPNIK